MFRVLTIAVAVIAVGAVVGAYVLTDGFHRTSGSKPVVLEPLDAFFTLPGGQFSAIDFSIQSTEVVNGTFDNTQGITLYTMTPAEELSLTKTGVVGGYTWTSGRIANLTIYELDRAVAPGVWDLVFLNSANASLFNTTIVTFFTPLTLSTG